MSKAGTPMRMALLALVGLALACAPPRAVQFTMQDGSQDGWLIECGKDEPACWRQASAACADAYVVHEVRAGAGKKAETEKLELTIRGGAPPGGAAIAGKVLVLSCIAPTVHPRSVAGPECSSSPPRPNHCDEADGETFTTGRVYLPAGASPPASDAPPTDLIPPDRALAELRALSEGLESEAQAIADPIAAVDAVVKTLRDFPSTYRMKPAQVKLLARSSLARKAVALPDDVRPEVAADLGALLGRLKAIDDGLRAAPDRAAQVLEKIATRHARVRVLALAASAPARELIASRNTNAADRQAAEARVAEIEELQVAARRQLDALRTRVTELSGLIMQALAKLGDATS